MAADVVVSLFVTVEYSGCPTKREEARARGAKALILLVAVTNMRRKIEYDVHIGKGKLRSRTGWAVNYREHDNETAGGENLL